MNKQELKEIINNYYIQVIEKNQPTKIFVDGEFGWDLFEDLNVVYDLFTKIAPLFVCIDNVKNISNAHYSFYFDDELRPITKSFFKKRWRLVFNYRLNQNVFKEFTDQLSNTLLKESITIETKKIVTQNALFQI